MSKPLTEILNTFAKFELLQVGESGHGKSTRMLTATRFGPLLVLDFDGKIQGAARNIPADLPVDMSLVTVENLRQATYEQTEKLLQTLLARFKTETPYATVAVDTFTNFTEMVAASVFDKPAKLYNSNAKQLWGLVSYKTSELFNLLQRLPCNLIVNCHIRRNEDGTSLGPAGKGGFRDLLKARLTDSHFLSLENRRYNVRVKNSPTLPVNTNIDAKFIDAKGNATTFDLSVFDGYAYTTNPKEKKE